MKVLLFALLLVAVAYAQVRPRPSEIFEAEAFLVVKRGNDTFHGAGRWRVDQPDGKAREQFRFDIRHQGRMDYDFLQRYDLGKDYEITGNPEKCNFTTVTGKMNPVWGFVQLSTFKGKINVDGRTLDIWAYTTGGVTLSLAVGTQAPNVPVTMERKTPTETVSLHFRRFHTVKPHPVWFTVPPLCNRA